MCVHVGSSTSIFSFFLKVLFPVCFHVHVCLSLHKFGAYFEALVGQINSTHAFIVDTNISCTCMCCVMCPSLLLRVGLVARV